MYICAPVLVLAFSRFPCHVPVPSTENWSIQKQPRKNITSKKYNSKLSSCRACKGVEMGGTEERMVARTFSWSTAVSDQGIVRQSEPKKMVLELSEEEQDSSWRTRYNLQQQFLLAFGWMNSLTSVCPCGNWWRKDADPPLLFIRSLHSWFFQFVNCFDVPWPTLWRQLRALAVIPDCSRASSLPRAPTTIAGEM